jgi:tRNA G18 (ribose-2'-O)-methylase SpoU
MEKPLITSLSNPLIKQARALHQKKARHESGSFLVEGIYHVGEAVEAGWEVDAVLYSPELLTSNFARELIAQLGTKPQPVSVLCRGIAENHMRCGTCYSTRPR